MSKLLNFSINKHQLAGRAFRVKDKPFKEWNNLEERIWNKFKDSPAYYFFNTKFIDIAIEELHIDMETEGQDNVLGKLERELKNIFNCIFESEEFERLYKETEIYKSAVEKQWDANEKFIISFFNDIVRVPLPAKRIEVFIDHPKLNNGKVIRENIIWGHKEDWRNYSSVYIAHELLHIVTGIKPYNPEYETMHAVISLATNNELRIRLNGGGRYFKENGIRTEKDAIVNIEKKILPYWQRYLNNNEYATDILDLVGKIEKSKGAA